jgi:aspartate aminotransferase-like enzyme
VEPGDKILVGVNGYFGHRMINMAKRYGGEPIAINKPWCGDRCLRTRRSRRRSR